jgi:hypothetical protein
MHMNNIRLVTLGLLIAGLAACGGGGAAVRGIESLGTTFQQAFGQAPNDTAIDISNADLALQLTVDPFEL